MTCSFTIHHKESPRPCYDFIIDRGDSLTSFRIDQFDFQSFQYGTEIIAEYVPDGSCEREDPDQPLPCDRGAVRRIDSGSCTIEGWNDSVIMLNVSGRVFSGTVHILKRVGGSSMRYVRKRSSRSPAL
jgi:hypothetical protein